MIEAIIRGDKNKVLRSPSRPVPEITDNIQALVKEMRRIMKEADGIGLAAPQIGKNIRVFVAEVDNKFYALVNPEITKISEEKDTLEEGCLSLPGLYGPVARSVKITIVGLNPRGRKIKIKAWGLLARVFQHEMDHLNGQLFVDKAKEVREINPETK
jgi:peptide deformylase